MDTKVSGRKTITAPILGENRSSTLALVAQSANDIAMVIDKNDHIADVSLDPECDAIEGLHSWIGMQLINTVTTESVGNITSLLGVSAHVGPSRWLQVNHKTPNTDGEVPVLYRSFELDNSHRLFVGRDLRQISTMRQELLELQHAQEDSYIRLHQAESRYRMLFQLAAEPILILSSNARCIQEANPAASNLFETSTKKLIGKCIDTLFTSQSAEQLADELIILKALGRQREVNVQTQLGNNIQLKANILRQNDSIYYLLQLAPEALLGNNDDTAQANPIVDVVEQLTDAVVLTDPSGRIISVNEAFLDICHATNDREIIDKPLVNWLGRTSVDFNALRRALMQRGAVRRFSTTVTSEFGASADVSGIAVAALEAKPPCLGFFLRRATQENESSGKPVMDSLGRSIEHTTNLVGSVPLKELVTETTDLIERSCIETALKRTSNNRASAADMLGLSRQSLYVKLRRHNIGELKQKK